jgi:hypothetical protein
MIWGERVEGRKVKGERIKEKGREAGRIGSQEGGRRI